MRDVKGWKASAVQSMADAGIPSGEYADVIIDFAIEFGGGFEAPEIKFMHNVARQLGCSRVLGADVLDSTC